MEISKDSRWNIGLHPVEFGCVNPQRAVNVRGAAASAQVRQTHPEHTENLLKLTIEITVILFHHAEPLQPIRALPPAKSHFKPWLFAYGGKVKKSL